MEHNFSLSWENPPRTMNKATWKAVHRFCRMARNEVEKKLPPEKMRQCLLDALVYGTGMYLIE